MTHVLARAGKPLQARPVPLPPKRQKTPHQGTRPDATLQQRLNGSRRTVPSTSMNSAPDHCAQPSGTAQRPTLAPAVPASAAKEPNVLRLNSPMAQTR